jgi:NADH-quinone oxidoreductase subunit H
VAFTVLLERKLLGGVQIRTGPFNVGFMGVLQTVVDGVKLLTKRVMGSKVKFCSGMFVLLRVLVNWNMSVMWIICVLSGLGYVFLSGVFYSECMYSMYGGLRAVISMISYDIILLIVLVVMPNL